MPAPASASARSRRHCHPENNNNAPLVAAPGEVRGDAVWSPGPGTAEDVEREGVPGRGTAGGRPPQAGEPGCT